MFDIPPLLFFRSKNPFTGSRGLFRFLIQPGETLAVQVWRGPFCYVKSEILETAEFPLDEEGWAAMIGWLEDRCRKMLEE